MSRILEEITIGKDLCTANIYLEFLSKKFKIAEKVSKDAFKSIEVRFFTEINEYCLEEDISGYTVYDLISFVREAVSEGNYNKLYSYVEKFDLIEDRARNDILALSKVKRRTKNDKSE